MDLDPFEMWTNHVFTFKISLDPGASYIIETLYRGKSTGYQAFDTLSDAYDALEEKGAYQIN